jgi:hypothetical protein
MSRIGLALLTLFAVIALPEAEWRCQMIARTASHVFDPCPEALQGQSAPSVAGDAVQQTVLLDTATGAVGVSAALVGVLGWALLGYERVTIKPRTPPPRVV